MVSATTHAVRKGTALTGAVLAALLLSSCSGASGAAEKPAESNPDSLISQEDCARNTAAGPITYISGYGYSASAGQIDVFMAKDLGYFKDLCLNVEINAAGGNGQQLVSAGQAEFTELGSAADVMLAQANTDNLTAVATYGTDSPFSIFTNSKIKSLKDLEGGTLGYFINLTPVAKAMLEAADVDISKVHLVKMTNYDPTVVVRGQVDAIVGYESNQVQTLKAMGEKFNSFRPEDVGLQGTYNVMEVNSTFLKENPEVVADFMRASLKALQHCLDDEQDCVTRLAKLAKDNNQGEAFPEEQLARTWKVESQWVRDNKGGAPGVISVPAWNAEREIVQKYGGATNLPEVKDMIDTDVLAGLYDNGTLIWPGDK